MRLMVLVAALAALATPLTAVAGDWRLFYMTSETAFLVDKTTVRHTGTRSYAWFTYIKRDPAEGAPFYHVVRIEFDCDGERSAYRNMVAYDNSGSVLERVTNPTGQLDQVIPDTATQAELAFACDGRYLTGYDGMSHVVFDDPLSANQRFRIMWDAEN